MTSLAHATSLSALGSIPLSLNRFPAKAGIQLFRPHRWTPAFAGEQALEAALNYI